jgi:hypothetical protein
MFDTKGGRFHFPFTHKLRTRSQKEVWIFAVLHAWYI